MRTGIELSKALPGSAAEEFGPLFAVLDGSAMNPNRRVVDLENCDGEFVSWHLVRETHEGIILRDGVNYWMEETLWLARRTPGRTFALRYGGQEYEFSKVIARRSILAQPYEVSREKRSRSKRAEVAA